MSCLLPSIIDETPLFPASPYPERFRRLAKAESSPGLAQRGYCQFDVMSVFLLLVCEIGSIGRKGLCDYYLGALNYMLCSICA